MHFKSFTVRALTYSAILIAIATVLSNIKLFNMPQGGTVTAFSMLFIVLIGYFFGAYVGLTAAVAYGLLQLAFGAYIIHPAQLILDYPLAFGALGLAGFFRKQKYGLVVGYIIGVLGRLIISTISGVVFFAEYAPEGSSVIGYSFVYNLSYLAPEAAITIVILLIPAVHSALERLKSDTATA